MNCLVTAGPTCEPLDEVRRLTNSSTGRLGTELADYLAGRGHAVTLLLGTLATWSAPCRARQIERFTTTADLRRRLQERAGVTVDAVFHAAAVSDFGFARVFERLPSGELRTVHSRKLSTHSATLLAELAPTPKLIAYLRDWFPAAFLVGWKFEVEGSRETVLARCRHQLHECRTNLCVANGPAYGAGFGLVAAAGAVEHLPDRAALCVRLEAALPGGETGTRQIGQPQQS